MGRFRFGPHVPGDLEALRDFLVAEGRPGAAVKLMVELRDAFILLGDNPRAGTVRREWGETVRAWPVRKLLVIYESSPVPIKILRVISGYRDLSRIELD